ncbi:1,4-alpha-glucan branching enzyme [Microbacterium terrae]|uniref:1,4-alpha-glucan branching enzyme GlgB n=1 Tax=Microbacterium terrae TaxID=69369 RepID=A0A0M2H4Q3_9MICO|nr:1,4-alpha-glucan branching protein GlgB [Microbacterium terrae]KJL38883.1 1,4-alpha-glucan branching enzyme GlgB [Microbacterium terrae]MBP1077177.1 1,4-alpha-glucan branching enzyme [Microbacterium terrae]GLJ99770.1 1,4-alpha-glucan branching enzyme GlgB [Microbacterium terrae]
MTLSDDLLDTVGTGSHHDPHAVLGLHPVADAEGGSAWVVRVRRPLATSVTARFDDGTSVPLEHVRAGIWEGSRAGDARAYRIVAKYSGGSDFDADDPYRFGPSIGELDLHLISEGRHEELWRVLGSHVREYGGVHGTAFAVWAPNARAVRVVGDFNDWDGQGHAMRSMGGSGVWEIFVPDVLAGATYKYELLARAGTWVTKADPMARAAEVPPATASVVVQAKHVWHDDAWMTQRARTSTISQPMSVYELHFGSWRPGLSYRDAADQLIEYVSAQAFTHIEFLPLAEHPFGGSWGYQVTGYYAPTSRFGHPDDLRYLIDRLHQAGIGVIMDWVPGHFPKDAFALARFDGEALYEHPDPRRGEHRDWGTYIFDFGRNEVRNFLVANALYWLEEFHVDGLRVDAVASMLYLDYSREDGDWVPNIHGGRENLEAIRFLQEVNATAYKRYPGIAMIAEESTSFPGVTAPTSRAGLGFGFKWNMGWMNDTLQYIARDPMYRSHHEGEMSFSFVYAFSENFVLPISHDEVVHGKGSLFHRMPGDHWQKLANMRAFLAYMWGHPGKQLLFMGQEFGQMSEWSEGRSLDWWLLDQPAHAQLQSFVGTLNRTYRDHSALWARDADGAAFHRLGAPTWNPNVIAFTRRDWHGNTVAVIGNFSGVPISALALDLPETGVWHEVLNTDATEFGGSGVGNLGVVSADADGRASITLPPLGVLWLRHDPQAHIPSPTQG